MRSTRVLVAGAGPVGLLSALCLRRRGIDVTVVDRHEAGEAKNFAVVLHPRTVALLANLGITETLLWHGHSFKRVAIFTGGERRASLDLIAPNDFAAGGLTLSQNVLRTALERTLRASGVEVRYRTRLMTFEQEPHAVHARLETVEAAGAGGSTGQKAAQLSAEFLIGADGSESLVRAGLGIPLFARTAPETYAFFDVPGEAQAGRDAELALDAPSCAMYPLHEGMTRYLFELTAAPPERLDDQTFRDLRRSRMPWQSAALGRVEWARSRDFRSMAVDRFGAGRVWLAGDAAHTTNPLGAQSLNVGLREGADLSNRIAECADGAPLEHLGARYNVERRAEWRRLMGLDAPSWGPNTPAWVRQHFPRLLAGLPASGEDLDDLLDQVSAAVL
jgi:2-polyprenyl-6-methoxyphenol hydroxylase-like FAD-dependent oxidoreductase